MNGSINNIDTDAGIGTILSNFSTDYITHVIEDSLNMRFRPFDGPMPNMVDVYDRQFKSIYNHAPDYVDKVTEVRDETFKEIINMICKFYNINCVADLDSMNYLQLFGFAHTLYDIFISNFTEYMINFFVSYIVNNADSIVSYLNIDDSTNKPKEVGSYNSRNYIDSKYILIHANINQVVYNMAGYDIKLNTLFDYFLGPNLQDFKNSFEDNGDIYKHFYACFVLDQRYSSSVLTNIKLKLQSATQEALKI